MVFLVAAGVVVPLVHRLGIGPVLGFLVVGLVIGPFGLARWVEDLPWLAYAVIADLDGVRALAELGVVFLLFMIGLELSIDRLWAMRRSVFGLGGAQVVLTGAVIAAIASLFENSLPVALVLGAGLALSSTAIVMQLFAANRRLGTATGQTCFAVLLFQDLAVLPILFLVEAFGARTEGPVALAFATALGQAVLAIAVILIIGRLVIRPIFRFVGSGASREMFLAAVLLVIIGTAIATAHAGLSMALGAFLAGLLFAETEYRHEIAVDIEPFKGLLLGLFFVSVGMGIDLAQVAAKTLWLAASVIGLFLVKGAIFYGLARLAGRPRSVALEVLPAARPGRRIRLPRRRVQSCRWLDAERHRPVHAHCHRTDHGSDPAGRAGCPRPRPGGRGFRGARPPERRRSADQPYRSYHHRRLWSGRTDGRVGPGRPGAAVPGPRDQYRSGGALPTKGGRHLLWRCATGGHPAQGRHRACGRVRRDHGRPERSREGDRGGAQQLARSTDLRPRS